MEVAATLQILRRASSASERSHYHGGMCHIHLFDLQSSVLIDVGTFRELEAFVLVHEAHFVLRATYNLYSSWEYLVMRDDQWQRMKTSCPENDAFKE